MHARSAFTMDKLVFGMHHLNISQVGTLIDGKIHYSHPNAAIDLIGQDPYEDFFWNKEADTCFYCSGRFGTKDTGNTRFFVSCDYEGRQKAVMCADGKARVVTLAMTHSGRDFPLYKIYKPNDLLYSEGVQGKATGFHIHLEVAEGSQKTKYWDAKMKVWRMHGEMNPVDAFFVLEPFTTVVDTKGLKFKTTQTTRMEKIMNDAEKLVSYAETQVGKGGADYWNYFGYQDAWCSEFVSYCGYKCGYVPSKMPKADTCAKAQDFYKAKKQLYKKSERVPKPGDIIFFGSKGTDHTAIVKKVTNEYITVIEGNAGDTDWKKSRVCETAYRRDDNWIWGYGTPLTQGNPKQVDISAQLKKDQRTCYVIGGLAGENGTVFKVPKRSTLLLHIYHNATHTANSEYHITMASKKAFKLSQASSIVSVTVIDEEHVLVKSQSGNPRTYWLMLE